MCNRVVQYLSPGLPLYGNLAGLKVDSTRQSDVYSRGLLTRPGCFSIQYCRDIIEAQKHVGKEQMKKKMTIRHHHPTPNRTGTSCSPFPNISF
jgi:hypothetical protein